VFKERRVSRIVKGKKYVRFKLVFYVFKIRMEEYYEKNWWQSNREANVDSCRLPFCSLYPLITSELLEYLVCIEDSVIDKESTSRSE